MKLNIIIAIWKDYKLPRIKKILKNSNIDEYKQTDYYGRNILHWCAYKNRMDILNLMQNINLDLNQQDVRGNTPLHVACSNSNEKIIFYFLKRSCDLTLKNNKGESALDLINCEHLRDKVNEHIFLKNLVKCPYSACIFLQELQKTAEKSYRCHKAQTEISLIVGRLGEAGCNNINYDNFIEENITLPLKTINNLIINNLIQQPKKIFDENDIKMLNSEIDNFSKYLNEVFKSQHCTVTLQLKELKGKFVSESKSIYVFNK